ncbi:MAG: oligosaccharide flippase family protein [Acidobacteria bacterium]|nr:oligosaccharide flippase family protein [Acidobacteriota bacterium]
MKSIFKSTAILGSSSAISAVVGLVSAKLWAIMVGPAGLGYLTMQQSLLGLIVMVAGLGVSTGIVRLGAKAIADDDKLEIAANQKAAIIISMTTGAVGVALLILFRNAINQTLLEGNGSGGEVALLGAALVFTLLASTFSGILNAHHNIKALAKIAVLNSVLNASVLLVCVWAWHVQGIIVGIIISSLLNCLASYYFFKREVKTEWIAVPREKLLETINRLLRFGIPFTGSMLVGTGVQLILPILILHQLDLESVGFYRAASTIAITSLALVTTAMGQDYYPRLSAASDNPQELTTIVNQQQYLLFVLISPIILWLLFLSPIVVPLLYTSKFSYSAEILNWFLVGDIFRLLSWTLSFVILARSKSSLYFFIEFIGGITSLLTSLIGMQLFGVRGLGISYLVTYFVYYLLVWFLIRRQVKLKYSRENKMLIYFTLTSAVGISVLTALGNEIFRNGFAIVVCFISVIISFSIVKNKFFYEVPEQKRSI